MTISEFQAAFEWSRMGMALECGRLISVSVPAYLNGCRSESYGSVVDTSHQNLL